MGRLPHAADVAMLPTFTPPASHQAATSRPQAPAAGQPALITPALPAATQPALTTPALPAASQPALTTPALPAVTQPALTTPAVPAATQLPPDQGVTTQSQSTAHATGQTLTTSSAFFPIPEHICTKIINLEYVDMAELKPSNWLLNSDETEKVSFPFKKRKEPVTDILVWVQCYSAMASMLAERYPAKIPHLMAYQSTIVKCAKYYQGLAWVAYNMEFRRKAAKSKSLDWGTIDQSAYAEFFTGSSRPLVRCHVCLEDHATQHCPQTANPFMVPQTWMTQSPQFQQQYSPQMQIQRQQTQLAVQQQVRRPYPSQDPPICGLFNSVFGNRCNLQNCSFQHVCSICGGGHNRAQCSVAPPPSKRPRGRGRGKPFW